MIRKTLLIAIVIISLGCFQSKKENNSKNEIDLHSKVVEDGIIDVGYIAYPPAYIIDSTGGHSGIFYDILTKLSENLDFNINYKYPVTWDGMISDVKSNKIDMVTTGIWPTSSRGKQVDFSKPLYYSVVKAYTYYGNTSFDSNISKVNNKEIRIATIDGEMTSIIAEIDFPNAKKVDSPQITGVSSTLLNVAAKKADVTFVEPAVALAYMEKNPRSIQEISGVAPLRVFPNCFLIPKGEERFKSTLNNAISELLNNGFVDRTIEKYETYPGSFGRVASPFKQTK